MKSTSQRNRKLDALKGIACIGIVFIHRRFPGNFGTVVSALACAGVALFFMISGYFACNCNEEKIRKKFIRTLKLLCVALLFYLIWESFLRWFGSGFGSAFNWITNHVLNAKTWFNAIIFDYDPVAGHLWFLFALVKCYLVFYFIIKLKLKKIIPFFSVVALLSAFVLEIIYPNTYMYYRNGLCYGLGFFLLGYILANIKEYIYKIKSNVVFSFIISGFFLTILECLLFWKKQLFIGTIVLATGLFIYAMLNPYVEKKPSLLLEDIGCNHSMNIYIIHWAVKEVFIKIDKECIFNNAWWYNWGAPVAVFLLSLLASMCLIELNRYVAKIRKKVKNDT